MISTETIDKIFQASHIEEVVSDFVKLKKRGVNYLGLCPFHNEKSPSFTVSPTKEIYKCFGCGKAGNSVNFIMEHEHFSYPEALRYLADKYKIPIEESSKPEDKELKSDRESMHILLNAAQKYFTTQMLESEEGKTIALPYFKERQLNNNTIEGFNLGWAPSGRDSFSQWAIKNGFTKEMLLKTGLAFESEKDNKLFDRFHERVMFPIHNVLGKAVGFGGRILKSNAKEAKYINSPETEVYQKSKILYGLAQSKKAVRQFDECILVEGYIDVLSLFQNGIENVAATSGTSLTEDQLKLIKRFTENVVFLFDGDKAGQKAALRGLDMALAEGLNVRVVTLPEEDDPDTFARKHKEDEIRQYLKDNSKDFIRFRYDLYKDEAEKDPAKKAALVKDIITSIGMLGDNIKRSLFLQEAAKILSMPEQVLYNEVRRATIEKVKDQNRGHEASIPNEPAAPQEEVVPIEKSGTEFQEKVIKDLILYGANTFPEFESAAHFICGELAEVEWKDASCKKIYDIFSKAIAESEPIPTFKDFINLGEITLAHFVTGLLLEPHKLDEGWKKFLDRPMPGPDENYIEEVKSSVNYLKLRIIIAMIDQIGIDIKNAESVKDIEELLATKILLNEMKKELGGNEMGITVVK